MSGSVVKEHVLEVTKLGKVNFLYVVSNYI